MPGRFAGRTRVVEGVAVAVALVGAAALGAAPVAAADAPDQIVNGGFDDGLTGWNAYPSPAVVDGRGCVDVPAGTGAYGAGISQLVPMVAGETYELRLDALTEPANASNVRVIVQGGADINYEQFLPAVKVPLTPDPQTLTYTFTAGRDYPTAEVAIQQDIPNTTAYRLCVDDVSLTGGAEPEVYQPDTGPAVRVNQVGYLPNGPKGATVVTDATTSLRWMLRDRSGTTVKSGRTSPAGVASSAGVNVHTIDFGSYRGSGSGFTLTVGDQTSHRFAIRPYVYGPLRQQTKTFYYTNRSGIAIDDALAPGYGREAGHVGESPNQGDTAVPCQDLTDDSQKLYAEPWTCEGTRDVSGGWYDAGDHGKYVVNGGISVAQLLMEFERTRTGATSAWGYRDGTLAIPENDNGVPDLLDEARWELEWMLKMQVPAGEPDAGMVFHKVADVDWTGLPMVPASDPMKRVLYRPSTAATLNLAATAAQGSRLFMRYDRAFAKELLAASRTAYAAAQATPDRYAPAPDGALDPNPGSGPYDDDDVSDEFYWAAAELYLTTRQTAYRNDVMASPHHTAEVFTDGGFDWGHVAALGRLDLATVRSRLPDRKRVKTSVIKAANSYLSTEQAEPFGQPYAPASGDWAWGSNSAVLNNIQVIGTAYDLTHRSKYADGVLSGLDYVFGRNALNISYVTGYGTVYSQHQHSRWYAASLDPSLPRPPDGTVAGGPNSTTLSTGDPVSAANLGGCVDQFCYIDDIGSWSTNEITINWNASLSWASGIEADLARRD